MKKKLAAWMAVAALLAGPGVAWAVPMQWTLAPTTLPDGTKLSGSFIYDADTDTYSNVNIVRTGGPRPSVTFTARQKTGSFGSDAQFFPAAVTGSFAGVPLLEIAGPAFFNAGGSVSYPVLTGECRNSTCSDLGGNLGTVRFSGRVPAATPASIPTLSEWGLIGLSSLMALAACVHVRRYRSNPRLPQPRV